MDKAGRNGQDRWGYVGQVGMSWAGRGELDR